MGRDQKLYCLTITKTEYFPLFDHDEKDKNLDIDAGIFFSSNGN